METKEQYLVTSELKFKEINADLYESEADTFKQIQKTKEKIRLLQEKHNTFIKQRSELKDKFDNLKNAADKDWEKAKAGFELTLEYIEGDKEGFLHKAEMMIEDLNTKIENFEEKINNSADEAGKEIKEQVENLKKVKEELSDKMRKIRNDSSEMWKDVKHWFMEKSKSAKDYLSLSGLL